MTGTPMSVRCTTCGHAWDLDMDPTGCVCEGESEWVFDTPKLIERLIESGALVHRGFGDAIGFTVADEHAGPWLLRAVMTAAERGL